MLEMMEAEKLDPTESSKVPPSTILKAWAKIHGLNPSQEQLKQLAEKAMDHHEDTATVAEWFSMRRLQQFEKQETLKSRALALQEVTLKQANMLEVVDQLVFMSCDKARIAGLQKTPAFKTNYIKMLSDPRIKMNLNGLKNELSCLPSLFKCLFYDLYNRQMRLRCWGSRSTGVHS